MMVNTISISAKKNIGYILLDAGVLAFIYFVPALSHMLNIPLYLFEPMRIMLFLSLAFTSKRNSYFIAFTIPLFSFLVSLHPSVYKSLLIAIELSANVFLFYLLAEMIKNKFASTFISIILSKIFYYLLKYGFLSLALIDGNLISTLFYLQLITTTVLSFIIYSVSLYRK